MVHSPDEVSRHIFHEYLRESRSATGLPVILLPQDHGGGSRLHRCRRDASGRDWQAKQQRSQQDGLQRYPPSDSSLQAGYDKGPLFDQGSPGQLLLRRIGGNNEVGNRVFRQ